MNHLKYKKSLLIKLEVEEVYYRETITINIIELLFVKDESLYLSIV